MSYVFLHLVAIASYSRAGPATWWKEKKGASRDKVSSSRRSIRQRKSPWEHGTRLLSQVTFSIDVRRTFLPSSFFFPFLSVRGPFEKSKRRKEFPRDARATEKRIGSRLLSFFARLYQDILGLKRNLGFCDGRGSILNGVPTFSCWRNHLICIMLLVLLGWRCLHVAGGER